MVFNSYRNKKSHISELNANDHHHKVKSKNLADAMDAAYRLLVNLLKWLKLFLSFTINYM